MSNSHIGVNLARWIGETIVSILHFLSDCLQRDLLHQPRDRKRFLEQASISLAHEFGTGAKRNLTSNCTLTETLQNTLSLWHRKVGHQQLACTALSSKPAAPLPTWSWSRNEHLAAAPSGTRPHEQPRQEDSCGKTDSISVLESQPCDLNRRRSVASVTEKVHPPDDMATWLCKPVKLATSAAQP